MTELLALVEGAKARVTPVRRRHILDGEAEGGGHRYGTGVSGKSEFPWHWSDDRVIAEIESVANDPGSVRSVQPNGRIRVEGTRDRVDIRVIIGRDRTEIITGHPTNLPVNP